MIKVKGSKIRKEACNIKTIKECCYNIYEKCFYGLMEELSKLSVILQIFSPIVICYMNNINLCTMLCFGVLTTFITRMLTKVYKNIEINQGNDGSVPVMPRRFTKRDMYGFVSLSNESDYPDMLVYMDMLETYFEKTGKFKTDKNLEENKENH